MARRGKTLEQQCKYYDCENFLTDVMLYHYERGHPGEMLDDYRELCKDAKQSVVRNLFDMELNPYKLWTIINLLVFG